MKRFLPLLTFIALLTGCASTNLQPVSSDHFAPEPDEKRIWQRSKEEQTRLDGSGMLLQDKELLTYLDQVARKLQPRGIYQHLPFQIQVIKNPYSNAFAFPNGVIYIHTGMLTRMENEAQLATLLAHEMAHATHRHQVRQFRGKQNSTAVLASFRATIGGLPAIGELATSLGEIGTMAAVTGYSRDMETEADMVGIEMMVKAGYDPREAPKLFQQIQQELTEEKIKEPFFFGSHPKLKDRVNNYEGYLRKNPRSGGVVGAEAFLAKAAPAILVNAQLELQTGRFHKARTGAEKYLSARPNDPRGHYLLGEILRQQGSADDQKEATRHFKRATALDSSFADAYRAIGMVEFKSGRKKEARSAFQSYLKLAPKAADRPYIEDYIAQCK